LIIDSADLARQLPEIVENFIEVDIFLRLICRIGFTGGELVRLWGTAERHCFCGKSRQRQLNGLIIKIVLLLAPIVMRSEGKNLIINHLQGYSR